MMEQEQLPSLDVDWLVRSRKVDTAWQTSLAKHADMSDVVQDDSQRQASPCTDVFSPCAGYEVNNCRLRNSSVSVVDMHKEKGMFSEDGMEDVMEDQAGDQFLVREQSDNSAVPIRRTKSLPNSELVKKYSSSYQDVEEKPKVGFFKGLFGRRKSRTEQEIAGDLKPMQRRKSFVSGGSDVGSSERPKTSDTKKIPLTDKSANTTSRLAGCNNNEKNIPINSKGKNNKTSTPYTKFEKYITEQEKTNTTDMKLLEFLDYYRKNGYQQSAFNEDSSIKQCNNNTMKRKPACFSLDHSLYSEDVGQNENGTCKNVKSRIDTSGRPLPPLPNKSKFPSALKIEQKKIKPDGTSVLKDGSWSTSNTIPTSDGSNIPGKFGTFFKKVTSHGINSGSNNSSLSNSPTLSNLSPNCSSMSLSYVNFQNVPGLEDIKHFKRVSFATSTYFNDPPQQICSKHPRKGEIEVKPNGCVIIHRFSPEEKKKILEASSSGVVVGGTGQLKLLAKLDEFDEFQDNKRIGTADIDTQEQDRERDVSHEKHQQDIDAVETAAEERGKEGPLDIKRTTTNNEDDVTISRTASHLKIDKPMKVRRSTEIGSSISLASLLERGMVEGEVFPPTNLKIPHDIVYSRCCHLREILPIPAIVKQLKAGSTDIIPLLQLRNPRPSLVEVWSFSDFISIVPVFCISLDGVTLSVHMFRLILSSLINKPEFEKLSLRNTVIDEEGWKLLCYFISKSKSLVSIDLTMVPSIKTNVQKPSKSSLKNNIVRMECNLEDRSSMNWDLLSASIATHGGLEEIIVPGAQMSYSQFNNFLDVACLDVERLGLAYNKLSKEQLNFLGKWLTSSKITGLDIGFNDLNGKLQPFTDAVWDVIKSKGKEALIKYISLNSTNLEVEKDATSETNEALRLISTLCYCKNLKFLDISNNPKMFPHCMRTLLNCLPVFVSLVRLHIDFEGLDPTSVVMLAEALPLCPSLNYLSILGTNLDLAGSKALTDAVRKSNSLITLDIDYDNVSAKNKERLSLYTMRNVQNELSKVEGEATKESKSEQLMNIQGELSKLLNYKSDNQIYYHSMVVKFIMRLIRARAKITKVVQDLFDLRLKGELNREGKESLIRLCFIDSCFEKGIRLLKERNPNAVDIPIDKPVSSTIPNDLVPCIPENNETSDTPSDFSISLYPTIAASSEFEQSGHSVLLPFGKAEIENYFPDAHETVAFRDDETSISEEVSLQTREEGNVFKKSADFMRQLENKGTELDKKALAGAAESLNSDQIKDFLLKNDISAAVNVIDELHSNGYHLRHIFKKNEGDHEKSSFCSKLMSELGSSSDTLSCGGSSQDEEKEVEVIEGQIEPINVDDTILNSNKDEDEAIDAAYDEVLDNLEKARVQKSTQKTFFNL